jgi:glycosyltransferase involved in cell wall biosynthesis
LNILLISHAFPPDAQVGSLRVAAFCRYLPEFGVHPVVLTIEDRFRQWVDSSLVPIAGLRIERTEVNETLVDRYRSWNRFRRSPDSAGRAQESSLGAEDSNNYLRRQMVSMLELYGPHSNWYQPAIRAAKLLIKQESIVGLFSSGPPEVSHRIARSLKEEHHLPWLADFRDPWANTSCSTDGPQWSRYVAKWLESKCIREADRVICNTEWMRREFIRSYSGLPQQKFVTLCNGFVDSWPPPARKIPGRRRICLHLGSVYGLRRIDTFCLAVDRLVRGQQLDPATFRIVLFGSIDSSLEAAARAAAPQLFRQGCIEFRAQSDRQEAQQALWEADLLLIFQGSYYLQIPAKLFEYLATGRPIFAVAKRGALTDMLEETGSGIWADSDKPDEIATAFLRALALPVLSPEEAQQRWHDRFHYRSVTARLAEYLRDVTGNRTAVVQETSGTGSIVPPK